MNTQRRITEAELHAFVDGELSAEERTELEAVLATAPADLATVHELRDINDAIRARYAGRLNEPVPRRIGKLVARVPHSATPPLRRWLNVAAALMIAVSAGTAGYHVRGLMTEAGRQEAALATTAIGAHTVFAPEVRHPVEVKAEEAHLVRWLAKRVGADVRAPALANLGWKLMGGRLLPDRGLPAAQFMYEDATGRRLTLYVRKETGLNNTAFRFYERDGFACFYWIDRPLAYALAGRLNRSELMGVADAVYAQLEAATAKPPPVEPQRP